MEVAVLGSPFLIVLMIWHHLKKKKRRRRKNRRRRRKKNKNKNKNKNEKNKKNKKNKNKQKNKKKKARNSCERIRGDNRSTRESKQNLKLELI